MRKSAIIGAVLLGGIALAGCSPAEYASEQPPAPGTPPPNAPKRVADPAEAETEASGPAAKLLINREQLKQLAELAGRNSQNPKLKQFAAELNGALEPQVAELRELAGHAPEPPESNLGGATGPPFDQQWKQEVRSLVEQAGKLVGEAQSDPELKQIATEITQEQQEITGKLNAIN